MADEIVLTSSFRTNWMFVLTAVEYHNAFTQTGPLLQNMKLTNIVTRDTQTAIVQPVGSTIVT